MPGRKYTAPNSSYRYGFNGQEKSDEIKGAGNSYTAEFWEYDPRLGRRWNVDPHASRYPSLSGYCAFANNPINVIDPDGADIIVLRNSAGAHGTGHSGILVGNNRDGWTYISKDGFTGSAFGSQSKFVVQKFSSIEEFRNSPHNFEAVGTHSTKYNALIKLYILEQPKLMALLQMPKQLMLQLNLQNRNIV
jgi:RHS repeat-associated protein